MPYVPRVFPQTVLKTSSRYNQDIRIFSGWGGYRLLVNGSWQSGQYIRTLWNRAFKKFGIDSLQNIKTIFVLGIGGGTVIELLAKRFPHAAITAVDIDSAMIDISRKYFGIDKLPNVRLVKADADVVVTQWRKKGMAFDLGIVDLFIGPTIPEFVDSTPFLKNLHAIVRPAGHLCINYLRELEYQAKSDKLIVRLHTLWSRVEDLCLYNNRFFFCC